MLRALLVGVVNAADFDEFQYAFESGIISDELLNAMNGASIPPETLLNAAKGFLGGITGKKIRLSTVKAVAEAVKNAVEILNHYKRFPVNAQGFDEWRKKTDALYEKIGKIN